MAFLEIETINLFHSPCSALIRFLRLSGQKAMNSHICCTCCSRVSFGSLLYRHSPAQAVTNRGQTTSITAPHTVPLTGRTLAAHWPHWILRISPEEGWLHSQPFGNILRRNCDSSCCQLEIPAEINCVAPHRAHSVTGATQVS